MSELRKRIIGKTSSEDKPSGDQDSGFEREETGSNGSGQIKFLVIGFGVLTLAVGLANYWRLQELRAEQGRLLEGLAAVHESEAADVSEGQSTVWVQGKKLESGYLRHVMEVFERLGYRLVNGSEEPWDVLWSHDYPFNPAILNRDLLPHQRVNHFPGSGFITNKVSLATSGLKHIPKAFHLPKEKDAFIEYSEQHREKLWVKKNNEHRGIKIEDLQSIDLNSQGNFVQEFVQKPFLIDGRKFDIGLYVTMTSLNPLRVYVYDDVLFRFCAHDYYPFNSSNFDSYVVADDYTPMWEMKSLKKFFVDVKMNFKQTFNAYMRSIGKDPEHIWSKVEESIRSVYIDKHGMMDKMSMAFGTGRHFFEMVRFDFVFDEDLNIYLMEANMSPNLSSLHFAPNKELYEHVIFNTLSLAGLASTFSTTNWVNKNEEHWNMMVSDKDLSVYEDICSSDDCHLSCKAAKCKVCLYCLDPYTKLALKDAHVEHFSRYNNKRLIPSMNSSEVAPGLHNELQTLWFAGMCLKNIAWCS